MEVTSLTSTGTAFVAVSTLLPSTPSISPPQSSALEFWLCCLFKLLLCPCFVANSRSLVGWTLGHDLIELCEPCLSLFDDFIPLAHLGLTVLAFCDVPRHHRPHQTLYTSFDCRISTSNKPSWNTSTDPAFHDPFTHGCVASRRLLQSGPDFSG